jgi:glutathione S-transferase
MKLYVFPPAPNGAKVRLYLAEKAAAGAPIELEEVIVNLIEGEHRRPEFLAKNPMGAIPVLELDDGRCIHESLAIIEYFEDRHPEPSLWGPDPESRAEARQIERIADLEGLIPIGREIHTTNSPLGLPANPTLAAHYRKRWQRGLDHLESLMADGRPFLAGDRVTVADCTLQAALQFARFGKIDALEGRPLLSAWCDRFRERETTEGVIFL